MSLIEDVVTKTIDKQVNIVGEHLTSKIDEMTVTFTNTMLGTASNLIQIVAVGALTYVFYQSVKMMFFHKEDDVQKIMFGYMVMLLLRIGGIVVERQMIIR